ncbi:MAG: right-handed parallel beta-helix repeat-containing protein [Abditibacteriaceae bacterium]
MKHIIYFFSLKVVLCLLVFTAVFARIAPAAAAPPSIEAVNYYVSSSTGDDSNNGLSPDSPWATLNKVNHTSNFKAGDSILFKRGDTFYGSMTTRSGTSGNPIVYGAYGKGNKPILTGFITLSSWTNEGHGIYSAPLTVPGRLNAVAVNGVLKGMGRYPNTGYLPYQSHINNTSITSSSLTGTPNWTGAELVMRKYRWVTDRQVITSQSGGLLIYNALKDYGNNGAYKPEDGNGFFIQGALATLDTLYEWYYDHSANKLYMYLGDNHPSSYVIKASGIDNNVFSNGSRHDITVSNIEFEGANINGIDAGNSSNIRIIDCDFNNQGGNGIYGINGSYYVDGGSMTDVLNNGVWVELGGHTTVKGMVLKNIGIIQGAGRSGDGAQIGIAISGDNATISGNVLTNIGYSGIYVTGDNVLVEKNLVDRFCVTKDDGGGIYIYGSGGNNKTFTNRLIKDNTVLNAIGAYQGVERYYYEAFGKAAGIYLDDYSNNTIVTNNTVINGEWDGILLHESYDNQIKDNIVFNHQSQLEINQGSAVTRRNVVTGNKLIAKTNDQNTMLLTSYISDDFKLFGNFNNNYYARPISEGATIGINKAWNGGGGLSHITLAQWKTEYQKDAASHVSPFTISDASNFKVEYNSTSSPSAKTLDGEYRNIQNILFIDSITMKPFSGEVLLKNK